MEVVLSPLQLLPATIAGMLYALRVHALAQRLIDHERPHARDELQVSPRSQLGVDLQLERDQPLPCRLDLEVALRVQGEL